MDYLLRDSHFAGVEIGKTDIWYLIRCLAVAKHGEAAKTLGITPKGIKAYEAFVMARHLMNKTVYYHRRVKVLEFMMEQLLREVLNHHEELASDSGIAPYISPYLSAVALALEGSYNKEQFLEDRLDSYIDLTEDQIWTLVHALSRGSRLGLSTGLAARLLSHDPLVHYPIEGAKHDILKDALEGAGFVSYADFAVIETNTTSYKTSDDAVYVINWDGHIDDVLQHSDLISLVAGRTETERLLVIIDESRLHEMREIAEETQSVSEADIQKENDADVASRQENE